MGKIPTLHLLIYGELRKKNHGSKIVNITQIKEKNKWRSRIKIVFCNGGECYLIFPGIPKHLQFNTIKEMIEYGLLKKLGRDNYELLECHNKSPTDSLGKPFW